MLTLEKYLSQSQAPASFGAGLQHLVSCSLFAARLLAKEPSLLEDLLQNHAESYSIAQMQQFLLAADIVDAASLKKALRQLRQRVMVRMIYRDLNGLTDLAKVLQTTTQLAEICVQTAVQFTLSFNAACLQANIHGASGMPNFSPPITNGFIVVGMGKLGGGELNVSSDIDLIFAYDEVLDWPLEISQQDFYHQLGKKVIAALDDVTEDGFVFRVDMRLRPFGSEGVLVPSLDALEEYYQNNGREWERYAWIKGRVIYPNMDEPKFILGDSQRANTPEHLLSSSRHEFDSPRIHALLRPFIFRKYLDYNALASMRELKLQIHRDVLQKGQTDNIKLGRGGIREIEFIAQVFQLIRGGRDVSLQIKPTLQVLKLLKNKGLLPEKTADELTEAYVFLRNLEHRLMYVDDAQTQALPKTDEAQARIAKAMRFESWQACLTQLNGYRAQVAAHFDATFNGAPPNNEMAQVSSQDNILVSVWQNDREKNAALQALLDAGYSDAEQSYMRLCQLRQSTRYQNLPELSRQRFDKLMPLLLLQAALEKNADDALLRSIVLLENICRRASYLALFVEYPHALHIVVKLCAASPWLAQYLAAHPILLDELLDTQTLYAAPDFAAMQLELTQNMQALAGDTEAQMDAMRHFKHSTILRFAAQDVAGNLQLETLSDYLSALADTILQVSLQTIWQYLSLKSSKFKHIKTPKFAVIGYGKLGGKELGYVSDLDIIFLYNDETAEASEVYARFAQRINNWFNSLTSAGLLYETDLQLRPDGNSGLLVSSVAAFREYQTKKAWAWEHQAITRARFVAGDGDIGKAFELIRVEVLTQTRDVEKLKTEVLSMREKMRAAQSTSLRNSTGKYSAGKNDTDMFELKNGIGGIIDVEFLVQYLVLSHANKHQRLTHNIGNIALLKLLASFSIVDADAAEKVAMAYREYRKMQHALKLQGVMQTKVEVVLVKEHIVAVTALWKQIFA